MSVSMIIVYQAIVKFILSLQLNLSKPQMNHLISMVHGIILCEGKKNTTQINKAAGKRRDPSCVAKFLKGSPWSLNRMQRRRINALIKAIQSKRKQCGDTRSVVFFIVDDTVCQKDRSTKSIEGLAYHYSHSEGKVVWSHSLVTSHIVAEGYSFAWDYRVYFRKEDCEKSSISFKSKNEFAVEMIKEYSSSPDEIVYVLTDSWYTSRDLVDACNLKGFHLIAGLKTNRTFYPAGYRMKISTFASTYIQSSDLRSVTVGEQKPKHYRIYTYEGPVAEMENVKLLLSWEDKFYAKKEPFCILCTDKSLDLVTILDYYRFRWNIETGYRYLKDLLGFDQYQMRSFQAIKRYWAIQFLVYNYLEIQRHEWSQGANSLTIGDVVRRIRNDFLGQITFYVHEQTCKGIPFNEIAKALKLIS
jgi:SRSO17 transposase